ncbi:MAG TPA: ADOP family duplicated permease [Vicinamibacterales bacterium]|nr:ADOP family duplicated permease [Vicinamibacterales bacterium]
MTRIESLVRDLRLGLRLLRKDAVVSCAAVISLGLAIGACTAAFALVDALILRTLPVRDPHRLVYLDRAARIDDMGMEVLFSYPFLARVRQQAAPHLDVFGMSHQSLRQAVLPDAGGVEEKVLTQFVSGNAFNALGVNAALGRMLLPGDDVTPGGHQVAVVSHAFWSHRFGGDARVLGQWIQIEQRPYQVVGVMDAGFTGAQPGILTDIWLPAMMFSAESLQSPTWEWLQIWGRLAPTAARASLQPMLTTMLANFEAEQAGPGKPAGEVSADSALALQDAATGLSQVRREFERPLLALAAIVAAVLLIACSNVANLLLARGAARRREMALRASIGAGRGRLLQQVLAESSVLTFAAAVVGLVCALAAAPLIVAMLTTNENPVYLEARLDWRVLLFLAALASATTALFGLAPALRASAAMPGEVIALGDRRQTMSGGMSPALVVAQIGFSLAILFVAGLLMRSFDRLLAVDLGFDPERIALLSVEARDRLAPAEARAVGQQLLARARSLPGVESASMSGWALFRGWSWGNNLEVPGGRRAKASRLAVSSQFFDTMRTRLIDGREFGASDTDLSTPMPVIVNDVFVRTYLPGARAVGQRLTTTSYGRPVAYEIVGVVAATRDGSVRGEVGPYLFSPIGDAGGTLQVRSSLSVRALADRLRRELPQVHPSLRLVDVTTQTALVGNRLLRERLLAVLSGFFAALGLALAAVGLYGVLTYGVVRRTREIGIRVALGAQPVAVVRSVLGGVAAAVAAGIVVGLAGGLYFTRFVEALLFEIEPFSVTSLGLPALLLIVVALVAAWSPARRATHVDPAEALRTE